LYPASIFSFGYFSLANNSPEVSRLYSNFESSQ
jgi:hypothetical protein